MYVMVATRADIASGLRVYLLALELFHGNARHN